MVSSARITSFGLAILAAVALNTLSTPALAAGQCVIVSKQGGRDVLFNRCAECRTVKVERKRVTGGFPTHRNYTLPAKAIVQLPFRGRGHTRVMTDQSCGQSSSIDPAEQKCIVIHKISKLGPLLVNTCADCRLARIEVRDRSGQRSTGTYAIAGKSYIPFKDAASVLDARVVEQGLCTK